MMNLNCEAVKDHLKFVEMPINKGIEQSNILTAQIYAQTNLVYIRNKLLLVPHDSCLIY